MSFFRIEMLFFVWIVPLLTLAVAYGMRRRRQILRRFASSHGRAAIVRDKPDLRRWIRGVLLAAAVLLLAVALAGPKLGFRWQEIRQRGVDLIVVLDCSRSMTAADVQPSRLERAKREVFDLLAMLQGDRVGLVAFAGTAFLQCPLTLDYTAFNLFLNALSPDYLPVGGTNLGAALTTAMGGFDPNSTADRAIILITDGENTGAADPVEVARTLKENQIKLFCIGVGGSDGVPIPEAAGGFKKDRSGQIVLSRLDETTLKKMAVTTGGTFVRSVAGDMDLDAIYTDEIRRTMAAETLTSGRKQVWEDRFQWPLALAVVCLVAELILPVTRKHLAAMLLAGLLLMPALPARASDTEAGIDAYHQGDFESSLKHFIDAQLKAPDKAASLYNVADAYYKTGNFDAAVEHYERILESDDKALEQNALYNLGNAEFRRGDAKKAIEHYKAALELDPDDRLARENLQFVEKALKQQQQQQQSGDNGKQDGKGDKQDQADKKRQDNDSSRAENDESQQGDQDRGNPEPSEAGQKPESGDQKGQGQQPETADESQPRQPQEDQQAAGQAGTGEQGGDPGQAERMLNRLQDRPGRALMGAEHKVEKDW